MAGNRTLKLSILADVAKLLGGLDEADKATRSAGDRIKDGFKAVGTAALAAGAAVGAFAVTVAIDGVKAAIEDEAAQKRLATSLKNTTDATNEQIAAIEEQILATSLATGVADDQLRPAFQRLATATKDTQTAQDLLNLALDISASTGKDLETVSNALGKAYEGNTTSLTKLGIGLSAADVQALGLEGTIKQLGETFGGAAAAQAETFQGRLDRLKVAIDETKEGIGQALLPILSELFEFVNLYVVPIIQDLADRFNNSIAPAGQNVTRVFRDVILPILREIWEFLKNLFLPIISVLDDAFRFLSDKVKQNKASLQPLLDLFKNVWRFVKDFLAPVIGTVLKTAFTLIVESIGVAITALGKFIDFIRPVLDLIGRLLGGIVNLGKAIGIGGGGASGGSINTGGSIRQAESGFRVPTVPVGAIGSGSSVVNNNTVNVNGTVLDPEGTARAVSKVVNDSVGRSGGLSVGGGTNRFGLSLVLE